MTKRIRCAFCSELAVAYRLEKDGGKTPICAYHIPTREGEELPELRRPPAPGDTAPPSRAMPGGGLPGPSEGD